MALTNAGVDSVTAIAYYKIESVELSFAVTVNIEARPSSLNVAYDHLHAGLGETIDVADFGPFYIKKEDGSTTAVTAAELTFEVISGGGEIS